MVTLSAPLRSINGLPATIAPEIAFSPIGHDQNQRVVRTPTPLAFKTAGAVSVVSPHTPMLMTPVWVPALIASNASFSVA